MGVVSAQNYLHADGVAPEDISSVVAAVVGGSGGHVAGPAQSKTLSLLLPNGKS